MFVTFFVFKEKAKKRSRLWTGLRMTWTSSGRKMQSRQKNSADSVRGKGYKGAPDGRWGASHQCWLCLRPPSAKARFRLIPGTLLTLEGLQLGLLPCSAGRERAALKTPMVRRIPRQRQQRRHSGAPQQRAHARSRRR